MADPGVSGQNFLRLLLGGAQKGVDQIPRQQAQQADLTLALQRMMQQQGQFEDQQAGIEERFRIEQERLKTNAADLLKFKQGVEAREGMRDFFEINEANKARINQEAVMKQFLAAHPELADSALARSLGFTADAANSLLPSKSGMDKRRTDFIDDRDKRIKARMAAEDPEGNKKFSEDEMELIRIQESMRLAGELGYADYLQEFAAQKGARERRRRNIGSGPIQGPPAPGPRRAKKAPNAKKQSSTGSNLNPVQQKIAQLYEELGINA